MMDATEIATALQTLSPLIGRWKGSGVAEFPTISTFEYKEELQFESNRIQPFLYYVQKTWKRAGANSQYAPSHWETGFLRVVSADLLEMVNAQGSGRLEVLRGALKVTQDGFIFDLQSTLVANDSRLNQTARQFTLQGNILSYTQRMSTTMVAMLSHHLEATLTKSDSE